MPLDLGPIAHTPLAGLAPLLVEAGWPLGLGENGEPVLHTRFQGEHGARRALLVYEEGLGRVLVYAMLEDETPMEFRLPLMELITRINYGLADGCLEMDLDDGEMRYRLTLREELCLPDVLEEALLQACNTVDTYLAPVHAVLAGTRAAKALADLRASLN